MRKAVVLILCFGTFFLCGCGREIDDTAYVVAIGVDKAKGDLYEFTFAIGDPNSINSDDGGGSDVLLFKSAAAESIFSAGDIVSGDIGQEINFSHTEFLLFSKEVARSGINIFLNSLTKNLSQRPKLVPAVADGKAKEVLQSAENPFEGNPEKYFRKLFEGEKALFISSADSREILCRTKNEDVASALPCISENIKMDSMCVFEKDKLSGEFSDILAYKLLKGEAENISFDTDGGTLMLNQRICPEVVIDCDDSPKIYIRAEIDGSVLYLNDDMSKADLYKAAEYELEYRVEKLLKNVGADIFDFDKKAKKSFLTWQGWNDYNWNEKFKKSEVDITVKINSEKTGLIKK